MKVRSDMKSIGYRSKGPEGAQTICALMFSVPLLRATNLLAPRGEHRRASVTRQGDHLVIKAEPDGYAVNHKRHGSQGEINIAWEKLDAAPADASGKGRLKCVFMQDGSLKVDISSWRRAKRVQDPLFEEQGKVLKP